MTSRSTGNGLRVHKAGLLTTVQDLGRWGHQDRGVPVGGPMDPYAHRVANRIVGNDDEAATLEVTLVGPEIEFRAAATFAVTGARFDLTLDEAGVPCGLAHRARAGARLRFGERRRGARAYLAVAGGIDVEPVFGSRATQLVTGMGGLEGRPLRAGDLLPVGVSRGEAPSPSQPVASELPDGGARIRVLLGPHERLFTREAHNCLAYGRYRLSLESNRMAYRLEGPGLGRAGPTEIISDATGLGAIQVPASGKPILLMADRATAGGYPKIATVITADLGLAGQLAPGDWIAFEICDHASAMRALLAQEQSLFALRP